MHWIKVGLVWLACISLVALVAHTTHDGALITFVGMALAGIATTITVVIAETS
ncbi:MAG: hypothetical protein Q7S12_00850 [bacterium]|nr:hypothetical protein [bacterium]